MCLHSKRGPLEGDLSGVCTSEGRQLDVLGAVGCSHRSQSDTLTAQGGGGAGERGRGRGEHTLPTDLKPVLSL